jgi:hypothetical protein
MIESIPSNQKGNKMIQYKTAIRKLAEMKASSEFNGGFGQIGTEVAMVAMIYQKDKRTVAKAVLAVYPEVAAKLSGASV